MPTQYIYELKSKKAKQKTEKNPGSRTGTTRQETQQQNRKMRYQTKCSKKKYKDKKNTEGKHKDQTIILGNSKHQHTGIISAAKAAKRTKKHSKNKQK